MRLLICDGHDSHISGKFIRHCIQHDIVLILLPPHSSHLLQPLDISIFGPLKSTMSNDLDHIFRTGISTSQEVEWFEAFIKAHARSVNVRNIQEGWRGAGIYPMNPARVLDQFTSFASADSFLQSETGQDIIPSFNDILTADTSLDATALQTRH